MVPFLISAMLLAQNNSPQTALAGIYTEAQAARGKTVYNSSCSVCHNADLTGFSGPPLKGDLFMDRWREFNLDVLYNLIRTTMPNGAPGSLAESNYLDVLSYLLKSNDLPAGRKDLTTDVVARTLLVGKNGPQPLPSSALVDVVGCLTLDSGNGWFLVHATEPARTLNQWEITPDDIKRDKAKDFRDQLFRLVNITDIPGFDPDAANGNKTEAKGTLVRQSNGSRINVTALQSLGATCEP
jgi:mono/diheme cytochrome c family protein